MLLTESCLPLRLTVITFAWCLLAAKQMWMGLARYMHGRAHCFSASTLDLDLSARAGNPRLRCI
jgi:hypothetical protein